MSFVVSWSGGKDGCFACYEALLQGYKISHLVNFISGDSQRVSFHGTEARLIQLQSKAMGISLFQKETTWGKYEQEFKEALNSLIPTGVVGMVFGDIYLDEHKLWVERVCSELGIKAVEPLWGRKIDDVVTGFVDAGFESVIVSAKSELIDKRWIGQVIDRDFVNYLKINNIDRCGENGEFHTLVTDGPIFRQKIEITQSNIIKRDSHWLLDTCQYRLIKK